MKLKYIIALALFFGNLIVMIFEQQIRSLSNSVLLTGAQRLLIRVNGFLIGLAVVLILTALYFAVK